LSAPARLVLVPRIGTRKRIARSWGLYLLLLLPFVYVFISNYIPMYGVIIAFKRFSIRQGILGSPWVGFYHFQRFLGSPSFWQILYNTIALSLYSLMAGFPIPILLAIGLNYVTSNKFRKTAQMITYAPYFLSTVILVGLLSQLFNARYGLVNRIIELFGGGAVNFMGQAATFRGMFVWSGVWQGAGYGSIIYIAALAGVDPELHEAASIDGASIWKRIWHIDIPSILPTISIMLILRMGSIIGVEFEKVFLMQNPMNTVVSETIQTYEYRVGISAQRPDFSFGAAIGLFQNVIGFIMVLTTNFITNRLSGNGLW